MFKTMIEMEGHKSMGMCPPPEDIYNIITAIIILAVVY